MRLMKTLLLAAALAAPACAPAAPADVAAAVKAKERPTKAVVLDPSRKPAEVLSFLGLERGDRALDLLTGSGYYAEIMARAVGPKGAVVAWEPTSFYGGEGKAALDAVKSRMSNVELLVSDAPDISLPANSFDFVLMHLVYHDFYWSSDKYKFPRVEPADILRKIHAATKPGGIVGVIDHVAEPGGDTRAVVEKIHRIDPAVVRADFERAGFVFDGESNLLRNPADDRAKLVFDPSVRGRTDRIVYRFKKPAA